MPFLYKTLTYSFKLFDIPNVYISSASVHNTSKENN